MAQRSTAVSSGAALDEVVWRVLTDAYLPDAWRLACDAGLDPEAAADACEVTTIRLLEHLDSSGRPPDVQSLSGWVAQTLLTEIRRARRLDSWRPVGRPNADLPYPAGAAADGPARPPRLRSVAHDRL